MKRLLSTWPYALGVVGLFGLLWAFRLAPTGGWGMDPVQLTDLYVTVLYLGFPALAFLGAALLGFRRGYDPLVLVVCMLVALAIPDPVFAHGQLTAGWDHTHELFIFGYLAITHLGVVAGIAVRQVLRRIRAGRVSRATHATV